MIIVMNEDQREAIRKSNQRRAYNCHKCGSPGIREVDGAEVGGLMGIKYKLCDSCGDARPVVTRQKKERLS